MVSGTVRTDTLRPMEPLWGMDATREAEKDRDRGRSGSSAHDQGYRQAQREFSMGVALLMERADISLPEWASIAQRLMDKIEEQGRSSAPPKAHPSVYAALGLCVSLLLAVISLAYWVGVQSNRIANLEASRASDSARMAVIEQRTEQIPAVAAELTALRRDYERDADRRSSR